MSPDYNQDRNKGNTIFSPCFSCEKQGHHIDAVETKQVNRQGRERKRAVFSDDIVT